MVGHRGSSAGLYLADPTSPIPSHCASNVATSTLRVNIKAGKRLSIMQRPVDWREIFMKQSAANANEKKLTFRIFVYTSSPSSTIPLVIPQQIWIIYSSYSIYFHWLHWCMSQLPRIKLILHLMNTEMQPNSVINLNKQTNNIQKDLWISLPSDSLWQMYANQGQMQNRVQFLSEPIVPPYTAPRTVQNSRLNVGNEFQGKFTYFESYSGGLISIK